MNKRIACVLNGFISLDENEKEEFLKEVERYKKEKINKGSGRATEAIQDSIRDHTIQLGPIKQGCLCCGK